MGVPLPTPPHLFKKIQQLFISSIWPLDLIIDQIYVLHMYLNEPFNDWNFMLLLEDSPLLHGRGLAPTSSGKHPLLYIYPMSAPVNEVIFYFKFLLHFSTLCHPDQIICKVQIGNLQKATQLSSVFLLLNETRLVEINNIHCYRVLRYQKQHHTVSL